MEEPPRPDDQTNGKIERAVVQETIQQADKMVENGDLEGGFKKLLGLLEIVRRKKAREKNKRD